MTNFNTSILISNIYTSRKIILELMEKQGYNVDDYANFSVNEVNSMKHNNQLDILLEKNNVDATTGIKSKIYIRYNLDKALRPNNIHEMIEDLFISSETLTKNDTLFIIIKEFPNETMINELKHIWETDGIFIVIECIQQLQFNILKHTYVPNHIIISEEEVQDVMNKYNITNKNNFPDISRFDPVARVIGLRPGQVCKIIRPSKTAIESLYYRICV